MPLPAVRAVPQPRSCSLILPLPCSKTAAQGNAGRDESRTLCLTFSGCKAMAACVSIRGALGWFSCFPRGASEPRAAVFALRGAQGGDAGVRSAGVVLAPKIKAGPTEQGCCGEGLMGEKPPCYDLGPTESPNCMWKRALDERCSPGSLPAAPGRPSPVLRLAGQEAPPAWGQECEGAVV